MENEDVTMNILEKSNFNEIKDSISDFTVTYIIKLIENISLYVDSSVVVEPIELVNKYKAGHELSQEITGYPSAYSAIDGEPDALVEFAEKYARLGIDSFDMLCKEAIVDFLNLHNGLFIVHLSKMNLGELSLNAPKSTGPLNITQEVDGKITIVPIKFSFGVVKFILYELP